MSIGSTITTMAPIVGRLATAAVGVGLAGTLIESIVSPGSSAHKTIAGRAFMQLSITALAYTTGTYLNTTQDYEYQSLTTVAIGIGGLFGALRVGDSILNGQKRFDSLFGRARESVVSIGVALAILHVGSQYGVTPRDTLRYASNSLSWATSILETGLRAAPGMMLKMVSNFMYPIDKGTCPATELYKEPGVIENCMKWATQFFYPQQEV